MILIHRVFTDEQHIEASRPIDWSPLLYVDTKKTHISRYLFLLQFFDDAPMVRDELHPLRLVYGEEEGLSVSVTLLAVHLNSVEYG